MKWFLVLVISPILLVQGLWTRKTALRLPEPDGERSGIAGNGKNFSLLILGDSAAAGVGVSSQAIALSGQVMNRLSEKYSVQWELDAENGRTTQDTVAVLLNKESTTFDTVLISLGVNDVTSRVSASAWISQCIQLTEILKSKYSAKRIIWSDLPKMEKFTAMPQPLRWAIGERKNYLRNALVSWIEQQDDVELLEFPDVFNSPDVNIEDWIASDGYHPGEKVYALWAETFVNHL